MIKHKPIGGQLEPLVKPPLGYELSYRDVEEMMRARGLAVDRSTLFRGVRRYALEIDKRLRPHLKMRGTSYRVDEIYLKVGLSRKYLYRAVNKQGQSFKRFHTA